MDQLIHTVCGDIEVNDEEFECVFNFFLIICQFSVFVVNISVFLVESVQDVLF